MLDGLYADQLRQLAGRFEERSAAGRTAVEINDLGRAATFGAIETLFVDIDAAVNGMIDEESGAVSLDDVERPGDYGVVDELCRRVILSDGSVLAVAATRSPAAVPRRRFSATRSETRSLARGPAEALRLPDAAERRRGEAPRADRL